MNGDANARAQGHQGPALQFPPFPLFGPGPGARPPFGPSFFLPPAGPLPLPFFPPFGPFFMPAPHFVPSHCLSPPDALCPFCGARMFKALKRSNSSNANPVFGLCCNGGKIRLPRMLPTPTPLADLLLNNRQFANSVKLYNGVFSMTFIGANDVTPRGNGPPTYVISGQLSHRIGHLLPPGENQPAPVFAQLYFHDVQHELANRMAMGGAEVLDRRIVLLLQNLLHYINVYVRIFRSAGERLHERPACNMKIAFQRVGRAERGTHAAPTSTEVAGILICPDGDIDPAGLDIVLERRPLGNNGYAPLQRISHLDNRYMPLQYPLALPWGDHGWSPGIPANGGVTAAQGQDGAGEEEDQAEEHLGGASDSNSKEVTQRQWAAYRLQMRKTDGIAFLFSRRLFQQAVVDMWAQIERSRLNWVRDHQHEIRADRYQGMF